MDICITQRYKYSSFIHGLGSFQTQKLFKALEVKTNPLNWTWTQNGSY